MCSSYFISPNVHFLCFTETQNSIMVKLAKVRPNYLCFTLLIVCICFRKVCLRMRPFRSSCCVCEKNGTDVDAGRPHLFRVGPIRFINCILICRGVLYLKMTLHKIFSDIFFSNEIGHVCCSVLVLWPANSNPTTQDGIHARSRF